MGGLKEVVYIAFLNSIRINNEQSDINIDLEYAISIIDSELSNDLTKENINEYQRTNKGYYTNTVKLSDSNVVVNDLDNSNITTLTYSVIQEIFLEYCIDKDIFGLSNWVIVE